MTDRADSVPEVPSRFCRQRLFVEASAACYLLDDHPVGEPFDRCPVIREWSSARPDRAELAPEQGHERVHRWGCPARAACELGPGPRPCPRPQKVVPAPRLPPPPPTKSGPNN